MRKWVTLLNDNPNDVSVTRLFQTLNKRNPPTARTYSNTARMQNTAQVNRNTVASLAVIPLNAHRCSLLLQNNSTATAPDTAPIMYFGFGAQPVIGSDLQLAPGQGIVFDNHCPSDAVYVAVGPFSTGFNSTLVAGIVKEGSITDPEADTANSSSSAQMAQLIALLQQLLAPKAA